MLAVVCAETRSVPRQILAGGTAERLCRVLSESAEIRIDEIVKVGKAAALRNISVGRAGIRVLQQLPRAG